MIYKTLTPLLNYSNLITIPTQQIFPNPHKFPSHVVTVQSFYNHYNRTQVLDYVAKENNNLFYNQNRYQII